MSIKGCNNGMLVELTKSKRHGEEERSLEKVEDKAVPCDILWKAQGCDASTNTVLVGSQL